MDLALMGGNILTMDSRNSRAEALVVEGGRIAAVGANPEVATLVGEDTTVVHLAGRTLIPGFIDPHNHFSINTLEPVTVDCSVPPHDTINGIKDCISAAAKDLPSGRWLRGWGLRTAAIRDGRAITRWELDEAIPDNPVCIMDGSVHACYANSAALALAGIDRNTPDPPHGRILRDDSGEPDGTLWEGAMDLVYNLSLRAYMDYYGDDAAGLVRQNSQRHLSLGITSVGDALVVPDAAELYALADSRDRIPMTLHQMMGADGFFAPPRLVASGAAGHGNVSDRLRGGTMKLFMDPVFPSSAYTRCLDHGDTEDVGEIYYSQEESDSLVADAHGRGMQVAIHCLGNRSLDRALESFEKAVRRHGTPVMPFRIEHFTIASPEQIRRAKSLGVVAVVQPGFHFTGANRYKSRVEELEGDVRPIAIRTMLDEGLMVAGSSDYPCGPLDPLVGIYAAVTRRTRQETGAVTPEEAVTVTEALRMYTMNAAHAMSREGEAGSLEPGKRADMVVLSHDPTTANPDFIRDINVEQTYIDGQLLYSR